MVDQENRTDLHYAASDGRLADLRRLLRDGADPNATDSQGFTPLHFAAQFQRTAEAQALLDAGALVDSQNAFGASPLLLALSKVGDGDGSLIELLLKNGADPDLENHTGVSPRSLAARVSNFDLNRFFRE
jgi:uncharacterized protein